MSEIDKEYTKLIEEVLWKEVKKGDRTDTGTISTFGNQIGFGVSEHQFPIITKKRVVFDSIVSELKWFLRGETHIKPLLDDGVSIWTPNAYDAYLSDMAEMSRQSMHEIHDREDVLQMNEDEVLEVAERDYGFSPLSKAEYEDTIKERDQRGALGNELGRMGGAYNFMGDMGSTAGPLVAVPLVEATSYQFTYLACALAVILAALLVTLPLLRWNVSAGAGAST